MRDNLHRGRLLMWNCIYARHTSAFLLLIIVAWIYPCVWRFAPSLFFHLLPLNSTLILFGQSETVWDKKDFSFFFFFPGKGRRGWFCSQTTRQFIPLSAVLLCSLLTREPPRFVFGFCFASGDQYHYLKSFNQEPFLRLSYLLATTLCLNFPRPTRLPKTRLHWDKNPSFFFFPPTFLFFVICTSVVQIRGSGLFNLVSHLYTHTRTQMLIQGFICIYSHDIYVENMNVSQLDA